MKRSALYHHHQRSKATFAEYHGWQLAASFSTAEAEAAQAAQSAGLADLSYRVKFEATAQPEHSWWRLGEGRYLVTGEPPLATPADSIDVTSAYASLLLAGPRSRDVLGKLTSLNTSDERLPNNSCAEANVGHVHTIVLREDLPRVPAYHLLVTRDYAESFWEAVLHAGHEFHLQPIGWQALERMRV
jgi:glycine cleavage system aminomethyltransferase T